MAELNYLGTIIAILLIFTIFAGGMMLTQAFVDFGEVDDVSINEETIEEIG